VHDTVEDTAAALPLANAGARGENASRRGRMPRPIDAERNRTMPKSPLVLGIAVGAAALAGCESPRARLIRELGPAGPVIVASIDNLGWGLPLKLKTVGFTAVVTTWDARGKPYADQQKVTVDWPRDTIVSRGATPQGNWTLTARRDAEGGTRVKVEADDAVDAAAVERRNGPVLLALLHRLRGPYNLIGRNERPRGLSEAEVVGRELWRVGVEGDNSRAIAYYFDRSNVMLQLVTAGADRPGRKGTVTVYRYEALPNGAAFPKTLRVVDIGKHVLVGDTPVWLVEISDVRFLEGDSPGAGGGA